MENKTVKKGLLKYEQETLKENKKLIDLPKYKNFFNILETEARGIVHRACKILDIKREDIYRLAKENEEFGLRLKQAQKNGKQYISFHIVRDAVMLLHEKVIKDKDVSVAKYLIEKFGKEGGKSAWIQTDETIVNNINNNKKTSNETKATGNIEITIDPKSL